MTVTTVATHIVFQIELRSAGVAKYSWNCSNPTNAPDLSCTLLIRIVASGASRNTHSATQQATSSACASRSCQCTYGVTTGAGRRPSAPAAEAIAGSP